MSYRDDRDITGLLVAWRQGDGAALSELMPATYRRLKAIAARLLRSEKSGQNLETTALVHEAYLRLADLTRVDWRDRVHFYAMSARLMRQVLVDEARARSRLKRSDEGVKISIDELEPKAEDTRPPDLVALDNALHDLASVDPDRAQVVELRFFGGLSRDEIAEVTGISSATVSRRWRSARAWLLQYLTENKP